MSGSINNKNIFPQNKDPLTGIFDRKTMIEKFSIILDKAKSSGENLSCLVIKLYGVKSINQYAGYDVGDALIIEGVRILNKILPNESVIGRFTGSKFGVLFGSANEIENIDYICKKIVNNFSTFITIDENHYNIAVNVGVSLYPQHSNNIHKLISAADMALEDIEIKGHDRYQLFNKDIGEKIFRINLLDQAIPKAIKEDQFYLKYQPTVDLKNKLITGAEALLRWESSHLGSVSPSEFIPRVESMGAIVPLGESVLNKACAEAKVWSSLADKPIRVGVNFSPIQLADKNIVEFVLGTLKKYNLSPKYLDIELTEHSFLKDQESAVKAILLLKEFGVSFSLDDFGTGYSSLSQLASYPINTIKIDQSLITGITSNEDTTAIVKAVASMAKELGISVLAEGVENKEEFDFLSFIGCDYAQGHYFFEPLSDIEFREILKK